MSEFTYLGFQMTSDGKLDTEVEKHIAAVSRAFGALCHVVFWDRIVSSHQETCIIVYQACVLSVLLYGECWTPYK